MNSNITGVQAKWGERTAKTRHKAPHLDELTGYSSNQEEEGEAWTLGLGLREILEVWKAGRESGRGDRWEG